MSHTRVVSRSSIVLAGLAFVATVITGASCVRAEASPDTPLASPKTQVHFEQRDAGSGAGLTLYRLKGYVNYGTGRSGLGPVAAAHEYALVCTAPCDTALNPGTYQFALSAGTTPPVLALDRSYQLQGNEILEGHFEDRSTLRTAGVVLLIAGMAALIATSVVAIHALSRDPAEELAHPTSFPSGLVTGGLLGGAALGFAGMFMAFQNNVPELEVKPAS